MFWGRADRVLEYVDPDQPFLCSTCVGAKADVLPLRRAYRDWGLNNYASHGRSGRSVVAIHCAARSSSSIVKVYNHFELDLGRQRRDSPPDEVRNGCAAPVECAYCASAY